MPPSSIFAPSGKAIDPTYVRPLTRAATDGAGLPGASLAEAAEGKEADGAAFDGAAGSPAAAGPSVGFAETGRDGGATITSARGVGRAGTSGRTARSLFPWCNCTL